MKQKKERHVCIVCSYVYDASKGEPEQGVKPDTPFDDLPEDFACPDCGVGKDEFEKF